MATDKGAATVKPKADRIRPTATAPIRASGAPGGGGYVQKASKYLTEVRTELRKTNWPTKPDLISQTQVVLGLLVVIGVFITVWDRVLGVLFNVLLAALGAQRGG
jgi:preprotein translocase subunit SecE